MPRAAIIRDRYFRLQKRCRDAVHHGNMSQARDLAGLAFTVAQESGDMDLLHRAITTRSMVSLETADLAAAEKGLREVVLESTDDEVICRAAFYLASTLRRQRKISRAQFFARKATEKAEALGHDVWFARCHNLLGNIYLNQSDLEGAGKEYAIALEIWKKLDGDHRFALAIVMDNLGYCLTLQKEWDRGIPLIQNALDLTLEIGDRRTEAECRQDLAHAYLNRGEHSKSQRLAKVALKIAKEAGYRDIMQNCYYMLGQLASMEGRFEESDMYFLRLQAFFPNFPHLRQFLRLFDVSGILTFH